MKLHLERDEVRRVLRYEPTNDGIDIEIGPDLEYAIEECYKEGHPSCYVVDLESGKWKFVVEACLNGGILLRPYISATDFWIPNIRTK